MRAAEPERKAAPPTTDEANHPFLSGHKMMVIKRLHHVVGGHDLPPHGCALHGGSRHHDTHPESRGFDLTQEVVEALGAGTSHQANDYGGQRNTECLLGDEGP